MEEEDSFAGFEELWFAGFDDFGGARVAWFYFAEEGHCAVVRSRRRGRGAGTGVAIALFAKQAEFRESVGLVRAAVSTKFMAIATLSYRLFRAGVSPGLTPGVAGQARHVTDLFSSFAPTQTHHKLFEFFCTHSKHEDVSTVSMLCESRAWELLGEYLTMTHD